MTDPGQRKFRGGARARAVAALAAAAFVPVLVWLAGAPAAALLRYERARVAAGEWWRLLGCHLVHADGRHLVLNLAGLALIGSLFVGDARLRDWLVVLLGAALAVGAGLYWLEPQIAWYVGLSGVLHGAWAAAAVFALGRWRLEALVTAALLAGKLALEARVGPLTAGLDAALPVVVAAHRFGAAGGLVAALAVRRPRASL